MKTVEDIEDNIDDPEITADDVGKSVVVELPVWNVKVGKISSVIGDRVKVLYPRGIGEREFPCKDVSLIDMKIEYRRCSDGKVLITQEC